jgi:hypothetical protein
MPQQWAAADWPNAQETLATIAQSASGSFKLQHQGDDIRNCALHVWATTWLNIQRCRVCNVSEFEELQALRICNCFPHSWKHWK